MCEYQVIYKQYLYKKLNRDKEQKRSLKEGEMVMNLWHLGTEEEQIKLAHTLLEMAKDKNNELEN